MQCQDAPARCPNGWRDACRLGQKAGRFRRKDSAGGTPTDAVETTALPGKVANDSGKMRAQGWKG